MPSAFAASISFTAPPRSTVFLRASPEPGPAPAAKTTASAPRIALAMSLSLSRSAITGSIPAARRSSDWSGLRISPRTVSPRSASMRPRIMAILPWPPAMAIVLISSSYPAWAGSGIVEGLVDEAVGVGVLGALDVADRPGVESGQHFLRLRVQLFHVRVFDFVAAFDLAHDQLRVADQFHLVGAVGARQLDPAQQRPVLGDVVGGAADRLPHGLDDRPVVVADDHADRRRPRVAARATVDVHRQLPHRSVDHLAVDRLALWRPAAARRDQHDAPVGRRGV